MKILFVSDNFPPEVNAPASRTHEHAKRWVNDGAEVTVLTCAPNFPHGRLHEGYSNAWRSVETVDGIRVVRVKTYISENEGFSKRILDYISFMLSAAVVGVFEKRPDVIVGTSPQFFAAIAAWWLSIVKWRPFVFELRDLWPASIVTVGAMKNGVLVRWLEKLELFLYRRAALVVAVTQSFKSDLCRRGIDAEKIVVVRNGVDLDRFTPMPCCSELSEELSVREKFVVAYLGTHGLAHDLQNVLEAAAILHSDPDIRFLFVGHGAEKDNLIKRASELRLANVVFQNSMPKEIMPKLWSVCDIALVHLKDDPVFSTVIPSKIFEAFGMAKPVMLVQPNGEAADIVRTTGAGEWIPPGNPDALAAAIVDWKTDSLKLKKYSANAGAAARQHSRDQLAKDMLGSLCNLTKN